MLDDAGRPLFNELLFGRRRPMYVAFDLLIADGVDLPLPLRHRKARLAQMAKRTEGWIALTNGVGEGRCFTEPWSTPTSRASSPRSSPTLTAKDSDKPL